ncbi:MAG: type II toxin-antitoxin system RelE/ParE family toxin [Lachnospiraceae bacterium]|nr:type II toxin-antitoxin system RelE/ParE family toxin [Lachnospiraceae bacterium]
MDSYNVIISPEALEQLENCLDYIHYTLQNEIAAKSVYEDAVETTAVLSTVAGSLAPCRSKELQKYGYKIINFRRHQYLMVYRVSESIVYVEGIFHQKQDYENLLIRKFDDYD